ncbi:hypothetical protein BDV12DRAFT_175435, partial [Aspergillus spectabilis]
MVLAVGWMKEGRHQSYRRPPHAGGLRNIFLEYHKYPFQNRHLTSFSSSTNIFLQASSKPLLSNLYLQTNHQTNLQHVSLRLQLLLRQLRLLRLQLLQSLNTSSAASSSVPASHYPTAISNRQHLHVCPPNSVVSDNNTAKDTGGIGPHVAKWLVPAEDEFDEGTFELTCLFLIAVPTIVAHLL